MATFDREQINEFIRDVENDTAEFIGAEFCAARIIGFISRQHEMGEIERDAAQRLLDDATHLMNLAKLGHRYAKLARNPSPEMYDYMQSKIQKERRYA